MFCIKPENAADWQYALFILSYYHVSCQMFSNGEDHESTYMVAGPKWIEEDECYCEEDLRLAEMAFQMNWHQVGNVCPHCESNQNFCGHLTFNKPIDPAF